MNRHMTIAHSNGIDSQILIDLDPGSGSEIRDPGSKIRDPRSGIRGPGPEIRYPRSGIRDLESGSRIRIRFFENKDPDSI